MLFLDEFGLLVTGFFICRQLGRHICCFRLLLVVLSRFNICNFLNNFPLFLKFWILTKLLIEFATRRQFRISFLLLGPLFNSFFEFWISLVQFDYCTRISKSLEVFFHIYGVIYSTRFSLSIDKSPICVMVHYLFFEFNIDNKIEAKNGLSDYEGSCKNSDLPGGNFSFYKFGIEVQQPNQPKFVLNMVDSSGSSQMQSFESVKLTPSKPAAVE